MITNHKLLIHYSRDTEYVCDEHSPTLPAIIVRVTEACFGSRIPEFIAHARDFEMAYCACIS